MTELRKQQGFILAHEDDRVVKVAGLRSAGAIRVGSIPTPRNGLVAHQ
jgi:hypothetical protein